MSAPRPTNRRRTLAAFLAGFVATWTSVFSYVLFGTYIGIGALAHDFGFSVTWALASTVLVWAGPAQVILISALGAGASLIEVAIAVGLSGVRLLPMVVSLLPMLKRPDTRSLEPAAARAFHRGEHVGRGAAALAAAAARAPHRVLQRARLPATWRHAPAPRRVIGLLSRRPLPPLMSAALLFLTPLAFLMSTLRNSRMLVDRLALGLRPRARAAVCLLADSGST